MGPGLLVTAAFIGPGTVTTARLGLVTRRGLAEAMRGTGANALTAKLAVLLVIAAIGFGNAAYEAGNIAGAALAECSCRPCQRVPS